MADNDFTTVGGGFSIDEIGRKVGPFFNDHWIAVMIVIVTLIIMVIAFYAGWIGATKTKEPVSVLTYVTRDGPGESESMTNSALATGYDADPVSFCASAGEPSGDPSDYLRASVNDTTSEGLTRYPGYNAQLDRALVRGMQH